MTTYMNELLSKPANTLTAAAHPPRQLEIFCKMSKSSKFVARSVRFKTPQKYTGICFDGDT